MLAARERLRALDSLLAAAGAAGARLVGDDASTGRGYGRRRWARGGSARGRARGAGPVEGVDGQLDGLAERLNGLALETRELGHELSAYCERLADGAYADGDATGPRRSRSSRNAWRPSSGWCASTAGASSPCTSTHGRHGRGASSWRRGGPRWASSTSSCGTPVRS